jgi:8-oxo-dGTP pyrophosphatase MutT (NUDIX family)
MIERHANSAFAGGALVFPGGKVDPGDGDPAWADHATGLAPRMASAQIAAVREAFEESGVLLARDRNGELVQGELARALRPWRARAAGDDRCFLELVRNSGLKLACDLLTLFSHWVAPPGLHRRFDTLFFAAKLPDGQAPEEDGDEATASLWISPGAALAARMSGVRKIIFPTARNLDLLSLSSSAADVFVAANMRTIKPVQPILVSEEGRTYLRIPEGLGYPITCEELDPALTA